MPIGPPPIVDDEDHAAKIEMPNQLTQVRRMVHVDRLVRRLIGETEPDVVHGDDAARGTPFDHPIAHVTIGVRALRIPVDEENDGPGVAAGDDVVVMEDRLPRIRPFRDAEPSITSGRGVVRGGDA